MWSQLLAVSKQQPRGKVTVMEGGGGRGGGGGSAAIAVENIICVKIALVATLCIL